MAWVAAAVEAAAAVRDLAEAVAPEVVVAPAGAAVSAPAEICGRQGRPQVAAVAAGEQVRVVGVREAAAKAPAVDQELAVAQAVEGPAAGAELVEVVEEPVPAAELALAARVGQAMQVMAAELVDPARAEVPAAAGAVLEALAAAQAVEVPVAADPAKVEGQEAPVEQDLEVEARLAVGAQQPSLVNG